MNDEDKSKVGKPANEFSREVGAQAARKRKAQQRATRSIWFGLGMSGLVGWSVVLPTVIGAGIGVWIDKRYPGPLSWTLMLLLLGLVLGCANAWHWVAGQIKDAGEDGDD